MPDLSHQFLCACLGCDIAGARELLQHPLWSWEQLFEEANREMVLPVLSTAMPGLELEAFTPPDVLDFLSAIESLNLERNQAILSELKLAVRLLNEIGIEPVLLKGAGYIATGVYQNPAARYLLDLDLLVPEEQLQHAAETLMQNGFLRDETDQFGRFRHHHPQLRRPGSIAIELHHRLGMGPCASLLPAAEVIDRSVPHDLNPLRVRVPCPEHLATHLILHSQLQHSYNERIWPPLRGMYDLVLLQLRFAGSIDWVHIANRFRRGRRYGVFALHLLDVRDALGLELPIPIRLSALTTLRRHRRQLLRRVPALRYLDPIYMFATVCFRRLRLLRNVLATRGGLRHFLGQLLAPGVYQRFLTDLLEGRGR